MLKLYEFLTGSALWAAFAIFIVGLSVRVTYFYASSKKECHRADLKTAVRSNIQWLIRPGAGSRPRPVFSMAFILFHVSLFGVPLFLLAHNTLWEEAFNISLPSLPDSFADTLTVVFLISALVLACRRIFGVEARSLSTVRHYSMLGLTIAPFLTGFLAYHQIGSYELNMILHVIFAEILLIVIPFSKMSHIALFFRSK
jgi:nitrate reductase gamma subunit